MNLIDILEANRKLEGRTTFQGLQISIENDKGSVRKGVDKDGKKWSTKMTYPYGYIRMSMGVDGDHVDCFLGPDQNATHAYVVHTKKCCDFKTFDEDKVMLGFSSMDEAKKAFLANYDNPNFLGTVDAIPMDKFKKKVLATKDKPAKIAAAGFGKGDQVTVDGLPGRGIVEKVEGDGRLRVRFRNGLQVSRDPMFVHMISNRLLNIGHDMNGGGPGSGCRGDNCGRQAKDTISSQPRVGSPVSNTPGLPPARPVQSMITGASRSSLVDSFRSNPDKRSIVDSAPTKLVNVKNLVSSQRTVDPRTVHYFIDNPKEINSPFMSQFGRQVSVVAKVGDKMYLVDGNHRAHAAMLLGKKLKAKVVDL